MTVPTTLEDLSVSEGSNSPLDSDSVTPTTRPSDYLRAHAAILRTLAASSTIAAGATTDLSTVTGTFITLTGAAVNGITSLGTLAAGIYKFVIYNAAHTITHNATSLILLGGASRTVAAGDSSLFVSEGSGNWREVMYSDATGYQIYSAKLTDIAALAVTDGNIIVGNGTTWVAESGATARTSLGVVASSEAMAGLVELATTAEAATGTDTERAVTPAGVTAAIAVHAIGEGQTWQDVTASRAIGTPYTNSTGRSIFVIVTAYRTSNAAPGSISVVVGGVTLTTVETAEGQTVWNTNAKAVSFVVPPGDVYSVSQTNSTLSSWVELR